MGAGPSGPEPACADLDALAERLGYRFRDRSLLARAVAHRSWCAEHGDPPSNERLEFLGDAVLGMAITGHVYTAYPELQEGDLAKLRAALVNATTLAELADGLGVGSAILLGRGEDASGGREKPSILADALEALIGAVYVDGGIGAATTVVLRLVDGRLQDAAAGPAGHDAKTRLQEWSARELGALPTYEVYEDGPDHAKVFEAAVVFDDTRWGEGRGRSKKQAEQQAARAAWARVEAGRGGPVATASRSAGQVRGERGERGDGARAT